MSRILHISNHFSPCTGGIETHVEKLCLGLNTFGYHTDVACLDTCAYSHEKLPPRESIEGMRVFRFPYADLRFYKPSPHILGLFRYYDIIHIHGLGFFSDYAAVTKPFHKKPLVLTTHGGPFHTSSLLAVKKAYFSLQKPLFRNFSKVIAVSLQDVGLFSRLCKPEYIPNGIDYGILSRIVRKPEKGTMLYVGRISRNKRVDNLIRLVSHLGNDYKLLIAGHDWQGLKNHLETLARELGVSERVEFLGGVAEAEKNRLLSKAEFFVSASEYEGFGISALEAMAAGCTPVLNDIDAFRELASSGRGLITDLSVPENAADEFLEFRKTADFGSVSKHCRDFAKGFDWRNIAARTADVYRACLA